MNDKNLICLFVVNKVRVSTQSVVCAFNFSGAQCQHVCDSVMQKGLFQEMKINLSERL